MKKGVFGKYILPVLLGLLTGVLLLPVMYFASVYDFNAYLAAAVYLAAVALALTVFYLIRYIRLRAFSRKIRSINRKLRETMDVNDFTSQISALADKTKSSVLKSIILLNLSTGYAYQGDYRKASVVLDSVETRCFPNAEYVGVYYNNKMEYLLFDNNIKEAEKTYKSGEKYMTRLIDNDTKHASAVYSTQAHLEMARGNVEKSEELFLKARSASYTNLPLLQFIDLNLAMIYARTYRMDQSVAIINYWDYHKMYPSIKKLYDVARDFVESSSYGYGEQEVTEQ